MSKILLLSPFPPAQNPRLLKEYNVLKANGYNVKVLFAEKNKWASSHQRSLNDDFILVGGKYGSAYYYFTRLAHKLTKNILPIDLVYHRVSWLLYTKARKFDADLYIGHNLAALSVIVKLAKKNNKKCGFDAEDFYRNIDSDDHQDLNYKNVKQIEDKYINQIDYLTTASPLINKTYEKLYQNLCGITINNVFPSKNNASPIIINKDIKLFWFSQTIGKGRGLELIIKALSHSENTFELHLLGDINMSYKDYLFKLAEKCKSKLFFHQPIGSSELLDFAAQFDIGLATEIGAPLNRDICLTNKIFTYIQSGLATIATDTSAQKDFFAVYQDIGFVFKKDSYENLVTVLDHYFTDRQLLLNHRIRAFQLGQDKLNWEYESQKFLNLIANTLKN